MAAVVFRVVCILLMVGCAVGDGTLDCSEQLTSATSVSGKQRYTTDNCTDLNITFPLVATDASNVVLISNITVQNSTGDIVDTPTDLITISLWEGFPPTEWIMSCSSAMSAMCMDRASVGSSITVKIMTSQTMGYTVSFDVDQKTTADVMGYSNCTCAGSLIAGDGSSYSNPIVGSFPSNETDGTLSTSANPCMGSLCVYQIDTGLDATIKLEKVVDFETLVNTSYYETKVAAYMIDVFNGSTVLKENPIIDIHNYTVQSAHPCYSSQVQMAISVAYVSIEEFKNADLMLPGGMSISVSTPLTPTMVMLPDVTLSGTQAAQISPRLGGLSFPTQTTMVKFTVKDEDKDGKKYTVGYTRSSCAMLNDNNFVELTPDGGDTMTFKSCTGSTTKVDTNARTVTGSYVRKNASLYTGDWKFDVSVFSKNAAPISTLNFGAITLAAVVALTLSVL